MRIDELIDIKNIDTSIEPMTKDQVIDRMISKLSQNGYVQDADVFRKAIYQRENEISTASISATPSVVAVLATLAT